MNVLSLFDGMSCGQIALDRAGIKYEKYFASEIDKHATKVAMHNYPDTVQLGDVCTVTAADLPKIDILLGGSPCQGFSSAGKGLNFKDPRSGLFFEFVRLKNELQPTYFLLENVSMPKIWRDIISEHLGVEPICINSARVSAQNRKRWYWTNIGSEPFDLFGSVRSNIGQPPDRRIILRDILESHVDRKFILSGAAIERILRRRWSSPKVDPDRTGTIGTTNNSGRLGIDSGTTLISLPGGANKGSNAPRQKTGALTGSGFEHNNFLKLDVSGNPKNDQGKASCFTAGGNSGGNHSDMDVINVGQIYRRLTPVEVERLQTLPDNFTSVVSDSQRYRMVGNGWTVDVIAWILSHIPKT